jgi:hypothetical protein
VSDKSEEFKPIMEEIQLRIMKEEWMLRFANDWDWMVAHELNFSAATDNVRMELLKHRELLGCLTKMRGTLLGSIMRLGGEEVIKECKMIPGYADMLRREGITENHAQA